MGVLETLLVIFLILWLVGAVAVGPIAHVLLLVIIVLILLRLIPPRGAL